MELTISMVRLIEKLYAQENVVDWREGLQGGDEWEGRMIPQELEDTSHFQLD